MLPWLQTVSGERFEYELNALLEAKRAGIGFHEVPIETIYLDGNQSSHFRAVRDSVRVYLPFLKFSLSSFTAFTVDFVLFLAFMALTGWLLASVVFARVISASLNFLANHRYVFSRRDVLRRSAAGPYAVLVVSLLAANYGILRLLTRTVDIGLVPAKLLTEATLFVVSYQLQRRFVFSAR